MPHQIRILTSTFRRPFFSGVHQLQEVDAFVSDTDDIFSAVSILV
jgi:hypothetical protein